MTTTDSRFEVLHLGKAGLRVHCYCGTTFTVPADANGAVLECVDCGTTATVVGPSEEHPTFDPAPFDFHYKRYGVELSPVGEDSEWIVAKGHVPPNRFLAAVNYVTRDQGVDSLIEDRTVAELIESMEHRWAVRAPRCTVEWPFICSQDICIPRPEWDEHEWVIYWTDVTADTPGAFPVTVIDVY